MKTRRNRFLTITLALVLLVGILACGTDLTEEPGEETDSTSESSDATSEAADPIPEGEPGTWLVMMYQDADDEVLEQDIVIDVNEAEIVGSTDQVKIVVQLDRLNGGYDGHGDVTTTKRYLLSQDNDLDTINSEELEDLGEVNMGDKQTLVDFATWAMSTYPSDHYVLILSDHGAGWTGGWSDDDPQEGGHMSMQDIDDALGTIIAQTGIDAFELVGFDACLMGQLEVMSGIAPHARYAVGSEETEPSLGWAYSKFLQALNDNTAMSGAELGQAIVDSYIEQDIRITDDQARNAFVGGDFSADSVAAQFGKDITLTAVDLGAVQNLNGALNELASALTNVDQEKVAEARAYAQSYTSVFADVPPSFIDLGHFLDLLLESVDDAAVQQAAQQTKSALQEVVVAEKHGSEKPASSGLTIYFPNSQLYEGTFGDSPAFGIQYAALAGRFATASLWDDYITFHYTGATFDPAAADLAVLTPAQSSQADFAQAAEESAPEAGAEVAPPGAGEITIEPLQISASEIAPDGNVTVSTTVTGSNIGYIYYYISYFDAESNSYLTADMDFLDAETTKESGGVYYPDWGDSGSVPVEFNWEPTLYYMTDGDQANDQFAFFEPTVYGPETNIYEVYGIYTFTQDGTQVESIMEFNSDGELQNIFGFDGEGGSGAPHQITPQAGDTFTITEEWLEFDTNPDGEFNNYSGGVMTFGDTPLSFTPYFAFSGNYTLGIVVEDLNGNRTAEFIELTVTQ